MLQAINQFPFMWTFPEWSRCGSLTYSIFHFFNIFTNFAHETAGFLLHELGMDTLKLSFEYNLRTFTSKRASRHTVIALKDLIIEIINLSAYYWIQEYSCWIGLEWLHFAVYYMKFGWVLTEILRIWGSKYAQNANLFVIGFSSNIYKIDTNFQTSWNIFMK
jgi:hypothetical protein